MRFVPFIISAIITVGLVVALNKKWGDIPPLGKFLSPQQGFWQNAEPADQDYAADLQLTGLTASAEVFFDERLVPHVFAQNDEDLYFIQGYLHAKFRLFQMDLQTKAAEGRASEIAGPGAINYDKEKRRLGMRYAAENALKDIEANPKMKAALDAYSNGVNTYIRSLTKSTLPLEYKLLDLQPEQWAPIRTALLMKMMAEMLASGTENDLARTNTKNLFAQAEFDRIYNDIPDSLMPIVPRGTNFDPPSVVPVAPASADSLYIGRQRLISDTVIEKQNPNNGSNNWVVAGSKTKSGVPILCDDMHLELTLPSIWYEIQLHAPGVNVYGVSLPGSPFVIVGFNEHIAWGVTNAAQDVKDYYEIKFKDQAKKEYWFDSAWRPATIRIEHIKVRGGQDVFDTVAYTVFGPVMYDESFSTSLSGQKAIAVRWIAHESSTEPNAIYKLNRATNYAEYLEAIKDFGCPAQNFAFASTTGDIAIWQQGKFPARWNKQGLYIMPGEDSSYLWQGLIPQPENPHSVNPARGYLQSANQRAADSSYPYFIPGSYATSRGVSIDHQLAGMNNIQVEDMMKLQYNYFSPFGEDAAPLLLKYVKEQELNGGEKKYLELVKAWDYYAGPASQGQTVFQCWWDSLEVSIWRDELNQIAPAAPAPDRQITMEWLKKDSLLKYIDNIETPGKETLFDLVTIALKKASPYLATREKAGQLEWSQFKQPGIYHVTDKSKSKLLAFARTNLPLGGSGGTINAVTQSHGPSWRMIVELSTPVVAYGVYPAGQNGNPGSKYYDNFVDTWVKGQYFPLWLMREGDKLDKKVKWVMKFHKAS